MLSGEGGDEIFAGYDTYAAFKATTWFRRVPGWLRRGVVAPIVRRLPVSHKKLSLEFKLKRFMGGQDLSPVEAHLWWRVVLTEAQKQSLYAPAVAERMFDPPLRHFTEAFERDGPRDTLSRLMRVDTSVFLPDDLMIKNDRMSMAHSLEARVPFTDPDLANYMSSVPADMKLPGLRKKNVMRRALTGILTDEIVNKKKVGLEMPYSQWLRTDLKDLVEDYLGPERINDTGIFSPGGIERLVGEHFSMKVDHGRAVWGLLNYMMWLETHGATVG